MTTQTPARIAIIDDHPSTREGLAARISIEPDLEVCCEAAEMAAGLDLIERTHPDGAVIDVGLSDGNGLELVKRLKARNSPVRMLVWSVHDESLYAERALRAGASGYITKDQATDTIIDAIRHVLAGNIYASESLTQQLLTRQLSGRPAVAESPLEELSDRELEVFQHIGQGQTTQEIAQRMRLSPNTIDTYRSRIRQKLAAENAAQLSRMAAQWVIENS